MRDAYSQGKARAKLNSSSLLSSSLCDLQMPVNEVDELSTPDSRARSPAMAKVAVDDPGKGRIQRINRRINRGSAE